MLRGGLVGNSRFRACEGFNFCSLVSLMSQHQEEALLRSSGGVFVSNRGPESLCYQDLFSKALQPHYSHFTLETKGFGSFFVEFAVNGSLMYHTFVTKLGFWLKYVY